MPRQASKKERRQTAIARLMLGVVLLIPIAVYLWKFGFVLSSNHTRWSEFGSVMGGIYAPVLALLTLAMLIVQLQIQAKLNEHTFDSAYVQDARGDLQFFLDHLRTELAASFAEGVTVRDALVGRLGYLTKDSLLEPSVSQEAKSLNKKFNRLMPLWSGVNSVFAGLGNAGYPPYSNNYATAKLKAIALLSYECCAGLDNLSWLASDGAMGSSEFSDAVSEAKRKVAV